jgi:hypothetical protein
MMPVPDAFRADDIADSVYQPPLTVLRERARRRTRKIRVVRSGVGAGLIALVALSTPTLVRAGLGPTARVETLDTILGGTGSPAVTVFDSENVVVTSSSRQGCGFSFRPSTDGGRTWPRGSAVFEPADDCSTMDPSDYGVDVLTPSLWMVLVEGQRSVTSDAGRTWHRVTDQVSTVDELPLGAVVHCGYSTVRIAPLCGGGGRTADPLRIIAVDLAGHLVQLRNAPPRLRTMWWVTETPDGALWTIGDLTQPVEPPYQLAVAWSTDRGRSWRTWELPPATTAAVVPRDGREAYVVTAHAGHVRVDRTVDSGRRWARHDNGELDSIVRDTGAAWYAFLAADGRLVVVGPDPGAAPRFPPPRLFAWHGLGSAPGFGAPAELPGPRGDTAIAAGGGLLWYMPTEDAVRVTTDGRSWRQITLPEG